jgi:hypothetical protein
MAVGHSSRRAASMNPLLEFFTFAFVLIGVVCFLAMNVAGVLDGVRGMRKRRNGRKK